MLSLDRTPPISFKRKLLEKQLDGVFDTDGLLLQDRSSATLLYRYSYRNSYLVMSPKLTLQHTGHTIDTITKARIQIANLSDGRHKMKAPPLLVNKHATLYRNILWNQSNLMGKYESRESWDHASIIDLYQVQTQTYLGSLYVYHRGHAPLTDLLVTDTHLYVLQGRELFQYRFTPSITKFFQEGEAENLKE